MAKKHQYNFEKVLRIGVSKEHALIDERLLLPNNVFSIGMDGNTSFIVDGLHNHALFQTQEGSYYLNITSSMKGKLFEAKTSQIDFDAIRTQSSPKNGDIYSVKLKDNIKGKVHVGDYTFIFQFIDAPPLAQREKYVKEEKLIEDDDLLFLSFTFLNSLCAFILLVYANFYYVKPPPVEMTAEEFVAAFLGEDLIKEIEEDTKLDTQEEGEPTEASEESKEPEENKEPEETEDSSASNEATDSSEKSKMTNEEASNAAAELEKSVAILARIGGADGSGPISSYSAYADGSSEVDVNSTDYSAGGKTSGLKLGDSGTNALDKTANIKISKAPKGKDKIKVGKGPKTKVKKGKIKSTSKERNSSSKCNVEIKKVFRKEQGKILYCYDREVRKNPELQGKITLSLTIKSPKNDVKFTVDTLNNSKFRNCVERKVKKWKFPSKCNGVRTSKTYVLQSE